LAPAVVTYTRSEAGISPARVGAIATWQRAASRATMESRRITRGQCAVSDLQLGGTQSSAWVFGSPDSSEAIQQLLARRGLVVSSACSCAMLEELVLEAPLPQVAIIDFDHDEAWHAQSLLDSITPRPTLVGICTVEDRVMAEIFVDRVVLKPLHTAHVLALVLELLAGDAQPPTLARGSLSGVVAGNELFVRILAELEPVLPSESPGATLAELLRQLGTSPTDLNADALLVILKNGELARGLSELSAKRDVDAAMNRLARILLSLPE
jgi:hypothetical protein